MELDVGTINQIGKSFDHDGNGVLEFDEFIQLRLEWDQYLAVWQKVTEGSPRIAPQQLLTVLEEIKRSMDPVSSAFRAQQGLPAIAYQRLITGFSKPFEPRTCETLIIRFGSGNLYLTFGQFC